jgi:hypothetical protein
MASTTGDGKGVRNSLGFLERFLYYCERTFGKRAKKPTGSPADDPNAGAEGKISTRTLTSLLAIIAFLILVVVIALHLYFKLDVTMAPFKEKTLEFQGVTNVFNFLYFISGLCILCIPYFMHVIGHVKDSFHIKKELIVLYSISVPSFFIFVVLYFVLDQQAQNDFNPAFSIFLVLLASIGLTTIYPSVQLWRLKKSLSSLEVNTKSFDAVLENKVLFEEFKKVLASQFCAENGLFTESYMSVMAESQTQKLAPAQCETYIKKITGQFIQAGSPNELNITSRCRQTFLKEVSGGNYDLAILQPVWTEIKDLMFVNTFPLYIMKQKGAAKPGASKQNPA